jgi:hypothetical protein
MHTYSYNSSLIYYFCLYFFVMGCGSENPYTVDGKEDLDTHRITQDLEPLATTCEQDADCEIGSVPISACAWAQIRGSYVKTKKSFFEKIRGTAVEALRGRRCNSDPIVVLDRELSSEAKCSFGICSVIYHSQPLLGRPGWDGEGTGVGLIKNNGDTWNKLIVVNLEVENKSEVRFWQNVKKEDAANFKKDGSSQDFQTLAELARRMEICRYFVFQNIKSCNTAIPPVTVVLGGLAVESDPSLCSSADAFFCPNQKSSLDALWGKFKQLLSPQAMEVPSQYVDSWNEVLNSHP